MASRRKKRKQQEADADPLGGFSLEELMGLEPITQPEPEKQGVVAKTVSAPFKLVAAVIKLPFKILGLPLKLVRAILPSRDKGDETSG